MEISSRFQQYSGGFDHKHKDLKNEAVIMDSMARLMTQLKKADSF